MLKHAFQSARSDGTDATKLQPRHWNADHVFAGGEDGQVLTRDTDDPLGASWQDGGGGGGTPASPAHSLQFNNAGAFGGSSSLTWDGTTLVLDGRLSAKAGDFAVPASFVATGTTTANATSTIVGIGTQFLAQVHVGDRIALSSDLDTYGTVTAVADDTHLTLDSGWWGDALGDGSSQTITVFPAVILSTVGGMTDWIIDADGRWSIGGASPLWGSGDGTAGVTERESLIWVNHQFRPGENFGLQLQLGANGTATAIRADLYDNATSPGTTLYGTYTAPNGSETYKTGYVYAHLSAPTMRAGGAGTVYGYYTKLAVVTGVVDAWYGLAVDLPVFYSAGSMTDAMAIWGADMAGSATNPYYCWFDSRGVFRIKEDSTFDSVGQAIATLYNPQFTKYTPGAANFERGILGQWNGNVFEIGTEKGGTGTLRGVRVLAAALGFYGVTPVARAVLATGASHTVDDVITALQNLGLVKQS